MAGGFELSLLLKAWRKKSTKVVVSYILLIPIFACLYTWLGGSFEIRGTPTECKSYWEMLYFSAVTITTLGYGEITPRDPWGKGFVAIESVTGIILIGYYLNSVFQDRDREISKRFSDIATKKIRKPLIAHIHLLMSMYKAVLATSPVYDEKYSLGVSPQRFAKEVAWLNFQGKSPRHSKEKWSDYFRPELEQQIERMSRAIELYGDSMGPENCQMIEKFCESSFIRILCGSEGTKLTTYLASESFIPIIEEHFNIVGNMASELNKSLEESKEIRGWRTDTWQLPVWPAFGSSRAIAQEVGITVSQEFPDPNTYKPE